MSIEPELIGDWVRERVLGCGGFGIVTLWSNSITNDKIAIKKYRGELENNLTTKHKERWSKEVEMMQRISNDNIVKFHKLPEYFAKELQKYNPSNLPMLSMEYCTKGDLRSILSRAENCCGLPESDVRYILSDLMNAVSYLHTLKITHRDLKPENIVLQTCNEQNRIIYKLIDLGYAKEIDATVAASFVGTLQYLAPEIFNSNSYSCSVDYWSMGLVAFEVICGVRPFLPNMSPAQWMLHVSQKKSDDICIYQIENGEIVYSKEIFSENHVSSCFKNEIEKWLKLALEFNSKKRGYKHFNLHRSENELIIFTTLRNVLEKKIITVFSVYTYEFFSYEIDDFTLVTTVQGWIERDTNIQKNEQFLLSSDGNTIKTDELVLQYFDKTYRKTMLYVFNKTFIPKKDLAPKIPPLVRLMLENTSNKLSYIFQKKSYAQALYFVYNENKLYNTLLDSCNIRINFMLKLFDNLREKCTNISTLIQMLIAQKNFSNAILNLDVQQYLKHYSQNADHWLNSFTVIVDEIDQLNELSKRLRARFESAQRRIRLLATEKQYDKYTEHELNDLLDEALAVFKKVRNRAKEHRHIPESCVNMVKVLYNVLKIRDKLLRDNSFTKYLQSIVDIDYELEKMISPLNITLQQVEKIKSELLLDQIQRQTKIWEFTIKQKPKTNVDKQSMTDENCKANSPRANFIIGNPSMQKVDIGEPISLDQPLHFLLGETQNIDSNSNHHFVSPTLIANTSKQDYNTNDESSTQTAEFIPVRSFNLKLEVFPNFEIGAPASVIINDNKNLRYELQEKTNESFIQCKSILSERLDFGFLESS